MISICFLPTHRLPGRWNTRKTPLVFSGGESLGLPAFYQGTQSTSTRTCQCAAQQAALKNPAQHNKLLETQPGCTRKRTAWAVSEVEIIFERLWEHINKGGWINYFIPNFSVTGPTTMVCRCVCDILMCFFKEEKGNASLPPASTELSE